METNYKFKAIYWFEGFKNYTTEVEFEITIRRIEFFQKYEAWRDAYIKVVENSAPFEIFNVILLSEFKIEIFFTDKIQKNFRLEKIKSKLLI